MTLTLTRQPAADDAILGQLFIDGTWECFTLEHKGLEIPRGTYPIVITPSFRFGRLLPLVDKVPGRNGIRIHCGNLPVQSEGCILVGQACGHETVFESRAALTTLQSKLAAVLAQGDPVTLTITDAMTTPRQA